MRTALWLACATLATAAGCQADVESELEAPPEIRNHAVGRWVNKYPGDPGLLGVRVQQFPDCPDDAAGYEGRHPGMVLYVFKDGRVNQVEYEPDGMVHADFWFTIPPGHYLWDTVTPLSTRPAGLRR